ncbi:DUF892 family protein [Bradyrhizobium sp. BR 1432]|uniref:DUF892 family protein n=1 Tax=Bradyrhizobium sp. BR 1432 TaxID=3447966 RepID=UPI003EE76824
MPGGEGKVAAHLQETNEQSKRLEQCLEACGESTSTLKDTAQSARCQCRGDGALHGWRRGIEEHIRQ